MKKYILHALSMLLVASPSMAADFNNGDSYATARAAVNSKLDESLYDAYTIIYADTDNTPAALSITANTIPGRLAAGIAALPVDATGDCSAGSACFGGHEHSTYLPLAGGTLTGEVVLDELGIEGQPTDAITDCSTFAATGGGIFYDDSEGVWKKCQDNVLSVLDTSGGGSVDTSGTPVLNDMARFTDADTIEGISYAEFFAIHDDITWGAAAGGSKTWTFDTGAGTDPAFTVSDTDFTFNKPLVASSFSAPGTASGGQYIYFLEDTDNGTNYLGWGIYGDVSASRIHIPPLADPTAGQVMAFAVPGNQTMGDGTTKIASVGTWITPLLNVVEDTTPQLGGNLDLNTNEITVKDADWLPIEWAEDGSTAPAAAAAVTGTTRKVGRAFDGAANEDVTFVWRVPTDFTGTTVTARVTGVVSGATAPADTEVVAFSVALACYANSEASTLAVGTVQTTSLTADATYAQYDNLDTAYSSAITPAGSIAAGEECAAAVIRLATTTDTYAQDFTVTGVEFKYSRALSND